MEDRLKIGFIGLGVMGTPMCKNLIEKSGCLVMVYDINKKAEEEAVAMGAARVSGLAELGRECELIFTMLPRDEHVKAVYEELFLNDCTGMIFVDMSTVSPAISREMANKAKSLGGQLLDAPVVKSRQAAETGQLGIYVGGDEAGFTRIEPFLLCMGSNVIYLGGNGAGLVMKLCHNMLVGQIQNGVNEMLVLAQKAGGIETADFAEAVSYGGGKNFYLESKLTALQNNDYTTAFATEYMHKDVHLAWQLSRELGMELEGSALVVARYDEAMEKGFGKYDFSITRELFTMKSL